MTVWKTQTSEHILQQSWNLCLFTITTLFYSAICKVHFPFHIIRYRAMHSFAEFKHDTLSYSYMYSQSQTSEQENIDIFNPREM